MGVAGFSALLHVVLHVRIFLWLKDIVDEATEVAVAKSINSSVKRYAVFKSVVNTINTSTCNWRKWIFLLGITLNMKIPGMIMPNNFNGELPNERCPVMLVCF